MTKEIDDCRAEEERLKGVRAAALKALNDLRASLVSAPDVDVSGDASLLQTGSAAQVRAPGCATPEVAEWKQFGNFFSRTSSWYTGNAAKLHEVADAWRASVNAHEAQIKKCDAFQTDFEHKFCMWHSAVSKVTDEYALCREREIKALDDAYPIVAESVKHRKADYTAVRHVQCLLKVLEAEDNDKAQGLKDCIATKVDTSALTVEKPPVPDSVAEDLETMINDIANRHTGITAAEEKVLDEAKAMCQKDSVEVIQAKHDADQKQINDELAAVNQCDTVRESMSADVNQRNTVLGAARDDLKQARDEEARLKGIMDTATATLESFIQNADSTKPVYPMPDHSDKEAVLRWFDERMGWYTENDHKYIELRAALKAAIEAYNAQVAVAAGKQAVFDARLCEWKAAVANTRGTYKTCRDNTVPTFDATKADVHGKEDKRSKDWTQIEREQCFLDQLKADPNDRDLAHQCTVQDVDTTHLVVNYPDTPASADAALAALGDLSAESPSVPCSN